MLGPLLWLPLGVVFVFRYGQTMGGIRVAVAVHRADNGEGHQGHFIFNTSGFRLD